MPRHPLAFGTLPLLYAAFAAGHPLAAQVYDPVGVQLAVPIATVESGGWTSCFLSSYANATGDWLPAILAGCEGDRLMLACSGAAASTSLAVLAQGPSGEVLSEAAGDGEDDSHLVNGAQWYYSLDGPGLGANSWGFADEGDSVARDACDYTDDEAGLRLCWHLGTEGGYRCGDLRDLNLDENFVKRIYRYTPEIFADDFEAEDTCGWSARTGDACGQNLTLSLGNGCGQNLVDQSVFDQDPDVGELGFQFDWNDLDRESGYRVQVSLAATFGVEDDYVELGPGVAASPVLHCSGGSCTRTVRVMAHVGHAPGHGASAIAGDVVSGDCTLVPVFP